MMLQGDLQAMDRLLELNGELDCYHGFGRAQLAASAEPAPLHVVPPPRALLEARSAADGGEGKLSSPQRLEKSRNREALLTCGLPPGRAAKIAALVLSVQQSRD